MAGFGPPPTMREACQCCLLGIGNQARAATCSCIGLRNLMCRGSGVAPLRPHLSLQPSRSAEGLKEFHEELVDVHRRPEGGYRVAHLGSGVAERAVKTGGHHEMFAGK
jgi:hypothetical protein